MIDDGKLTPTETTGPNADAANATPPPPPTDARDVRQPPLPPLPPLPDEEDEPEESVLGDRITRLSGEPAPDISPEEFARLQRSGNPINIDPRGRIRVNRDSADDPGVVLRKRRAWYA